MRYNRRDFIHLSAAASAGLLTTKLAGLAGCNKASNAFGLQLYTLRDILPSDPKGILQQLGRFGYTQIESYDHETLGMYWGMKPVDFAAFLKDNGMRLISSHTDVYKDLPAKAAAAASVGMRYLICPWLGPKPSIDDYKKAAEHFNAFGKVCAEHGLRFAYHNHDYSFKPIDGQLPQDVLMNSTDPSLVDFEMDIYWVVKSGHDPVSWLKNHPGRFRLVHIKDKRNDETATLGTGSIDFKTIIPEAIRYGVQYQLVEQEHYGGSTPLDAVKANADYMKRLM